MGTVDERQQGANASTAERPTVETNVCTWIQKNCPWLQLLLMTKIKQVTLPPICGWSMLLRFLFSLCVGKSDVFSHVTLKQKLDRKKNNIAPFQSICKTMIYFSCCGHKTHLDDNLQDVALSLSHFSNLLLWSTMVKRHSNRNSDTSHFASVKGPY